MHAIRGFTQSKTRRQMARTVIVRLPESGAAEKTASTERQVRLVLTFREGARCSSSPVLFSPGVTTRRFVEEQTLLYG
jgi:hypothetical protein